MTNRGPNWRRWSILRDGKSSFLRARTRSFAPQSDITEQLGARRGQGSRGARGRRSAPLRSGRPRLCGARQSRCALSGPGDRAPVAPRRRATRASVSRWRATRRRRRSTPSASRSRRAAACAKRSSASSATTASSRTPRSSDSRSVAPRTGSRSHLAARASVARGHRRGHGRRRAPLSIADQSPVRAAVGRASPARPS